MLKKLQYACLVGTIGLIGADRIDLFFRRGPFTLTPFLVLAPLVLLLGLLRTGPHKLFRFTVTPPVRRQYPFLAAYLMFLFLAFASILFGIDSGRGLVLFCDLLIVAVLGHGISVRILAEPAQEKLILRSICFALLVYVIFCIGECIAWRHGIVAAENPGAGIEAMFAPAAFGPWAPRLSGATSDASRAGFVLVMYWALLERFAAKARQTRVLRFVIGLLILMTISISAIFCWFAYLLFSASLLARLKTPRALIRIAAFCAIATLVSLVYQREITDLAEAYEITNAVSSRTSMDEGSSGKNHILLIGKGLDIWLTSTKTIIAGIGFGSAPSVLADFFGDDKYGNFHCLYVTVLAEMGLPAFCILLVLLGYPAIGRKRALACVAAIAIFNISYQSHMEPLFWVVLALLWSYEPSRPTKLLLKFCLSSVMTLST